MINRAVSGGSKMRWISANQNHFHWICCIGAHLYRHDVEESQECMMWTHGISAGHISSCSNDNPIPVNHRVVTLQSRLSALRTSILNPMIRLHTYFLFGYHHLIFCWQYKWVDTDKETTFMLLVYTYIFKSKRNKTWWNSNRWANCQRIVSMIRKTTFIALKIHALHCPRSRRFHLIKKGNGVIHLLLNLYWSRWPFCGSPPPLFSFLFPLPLLKTLMSKQQTHTSKTTKKNMQTPSPDVSEAGNVEMWIWFNFFFLARSWCLLLV